MEEAGSSSPGFQPGRRSEGGVELCVVFSQGSYRTLAISPLQILDGVDRSEGAGERGHVRDSQLDGTPADFVAVASGARAARQYYHEVQSAVAHHVEYERVVPDFGQFNGWYAAFHEIPVRAFRAEKRKPHFVEVVCHRHNEFFVFVAAHAYEDVAFCG